MKKSNLSKKKIKSATSYRSTQKVIDCLNVIIKNKHTRKEAISVVRALNGKRIRNKSGI